VHAARKLANSAWARIDLNNLKVNVAHAACLMLVIFWTGCTASMAKHTIRATGRFARASVISGGNFAGAVTSTAIGTGINFAAGAATRNAGTQLVTLIHPATGAAQNLIWRSGMNIYTARRALAIRSAPPTFELVRGKKTLLATFDTILQPGDVVRWMKP
jgi:hypothetical protein